MLALLGDDPHGKDGNDHHKDQAAEAEDEFKIAHCRLDVVQHGADPDKGQQKGAEYIGGEGMEIQAQLVLQHGDHMGFASFCLVPSPASWGDASWTLSVSCKNTCSRLAFSSRSSNRGFFAWAKARKMERESR